MKFICTIKVNKRGNKYNTRPTRTANGFMKHYGNGSVKMTEVMRRLAIYGTLDSLAKQRFDIIWITVMCPQDNSYTKRVAILKKNRKQFVLRMPLSERNKTSFK